MIEIKDERELIKLLEGYSVNVRPTVVPTELECKVFIEGRREKVKIIQEEEVFYRGLSKWLEEVESKVGLGERVLDIGMKRVRSEVRELQRDWGKMYVLERSKLITRVMGLRNIVWVRDMVDSNVVPIELLLMRVLGVEIKYGEVREKREKLHKYDEFLVKEEHKEKLEEFFRREKGGVIVG